MGGVGFSIDDVCNNREILNLILTGIQDLQQRMANMTVEFDALVAQVTAAEDTMLDAITTIQDLIAQLVAVRDDPARMVAVTTELKTRVDALKAVIDAIAPPV